MISTKPALPNPSLLLLALLPLLPWLAPWHLQPVTSFHFEWLAIALGLLAALAALPLLWRTERVAVPQTFWLPVALVVYLLLQTALLPQVVGPHALMAVIYLVWVALLMALIGLLRVQLGAESVSRWLAGGLLAGAVCVAGRELWYRLTGETGNWGGVGQQNNYADLLALGGASLLYVQASCRLPRWLPALLGLIIVLGLSLTASRSVWLYWAALAVLCWRYQRVWLKSLLLGFAVYVLLQGLWTLDVLPAQQSAAERVLQQASGTSPRWHIWQVAWHLFLQQPLLGHGFGQFDTAYFQAGQYIPELPTFIEHAHNLILHLLAELGLLPVLLLLLALGGWWRQLSASESASATNKTTELSTPIRVWLMLLAAILAIHSLLEYPLWYSPFLGIAAMILAMGDTLCTPFVWRKNATILAGMLLVFVSGLAAVHEWHYTKMELALLAVVAQPTEQRSEHLVTVCQQAADSAPLLKPYIPAVFTFTANPNNAEMRQEMTQLADAAVRFTPANNLVYRLALMQALNDQHADAQKTLGQALAAYPTDAGKFIMDIMHLKGPDSRKVNFMLPMLAPVLGAKIVAGNANTMLPKAH